MCVCGCVFCLFLVYESDQATSAHPLSHFRSSFFRAGQNSKPFTSSLFHTMIKIFTILLLTSCTHSLIPSTNSILKCSTRHPNILRRSKERCNRQHYQTTLRVSPNQINQENQDLPNITSQSASHSTSQPPTAQTTTQTTEIGAEIGGASEKQWQLNGPHTSVTRKYRVYLKKLWRETSKDARETLNRRKLVKAITTLERALENERVAFQDEEVREGGGREKREKRKKNKRGSESPRYKSTHQNATQLKLLPLPNLS